MVCAREAARHPAGVIQRRRGCPVLVKQGLLLVQSWWGRGRKELNLCMLREQVRVASRAYSFQPLPGHGDGGLEQTVLVLLLRWGPLCRAPPPAPRRLCPGPRRPAGLRALRGLRAELDAHPQAGAREKRLQNMLVVGRVDEALEVFHACHVLELWLPLRLGQLLATHRRAAAGLVVQVAWPHRLPRHEHQPVRVSLTSLKVSPDVLPPLLLHLRPDHLPRLLLLDPVRDRSHSLAVALQHLRCQHLFQLLLGFLVKAALEGLVD
mmetsp:Transcript_67036/g.216126  ORF Transcript_67036/g.216126 Transcript_67036/m.216126 type:complete len:265 (+) Transcript_67036:493-1287(+)